MSIILDLILGIYSIQFKRFYFKKQIIFPYFLAIQDFTWNFEHLEKKLSLTALLFPMLFIPKNVVT